VISGDTRFKEIFDVVAQEVPIEEIGKLVHPDDLERFWADREVWLNSVDRKPYADEYRVRRRDGAFRWVEAHWLAYFKGAGREQSIAGVVGTVQDITERKEREEKEHLLMQEINHRAKNMLGVVDAIARQTATETPEDFTRCLSERYGHLQPIRTCSSGANGRRWRSRTSFAHSSRRLPISLVPASPCKAPGCA
jgi:PAS domain S-box-containing protein